MSPSVWLSLLDRSRTRAGESDAQALHRTVARAVRAERLGFHRFWVAEHHGVPGIASGSPPVLLAALGALTSRIRLGSGGVMLPNHQPMVVAEQFAMLEALYPGRIDLGVGRSLGFTAPVRSALRVGETPPDAFAHDLAELRGYLEGTAAVTARPRVASPPVFVLATGAGLEIAARAGLPVVVGGPVLREADALRRYRDEFVAHGPADSPYVVVSLEVMIAETTERARQLLLPEAWAHASSRDTGSFEPLESVSAVQARTLTPRQQRTVDASLAGAIFGDTASVRAELAALVRDTGADEILASTSTTDAADLAAADDALARVFGVADRPTP